VSSTFPAQAPASIQPATPATGLGRLRSLLPAEGWSTVLLHIAIVLATAWAIERASWAPERPALTAVAVLGLLTGLALAKLRAPDLLAHLVALWLGVVVIVAITVERMTNSAGSRRERLALLGEQVLEWYRAVLSGRSVDDPQLFAVLLGLTMWLVAYTSAWVLYRRGWLTTAIVLPGVITVVNLGYAPASGTWPLLVFIVAACLLAARHHIYRREIEWSVVRLPRPRRLPGHFLLAGCAVALVVGALAWTVPLTGRAQLVEAIWERVHQPWDNLVDKVDQWIAAVAGPGETDGGSYASFGEQFDLGGALNLSDDPVLLLEPSSEQYRPTYLIGYRYDQYTGRGWSTTVEETFQQPSDDAQYSPLLSFASGQGMNLTPSVTTDRSQIVTNLRVLQPKGSLLFTTDTYLTSDRQTSVQLPWRQVTDQTFDLSPGDESNAVVQNRIPVELRQFASLLMRAEFPPSADSPAPIDSALAAEIETARLRLEDQRFLTVTWQTGPDGRATQLSVTGQLPVYDDVEAVFGRQPVRSGDEYQVTGLASTASAAELQQAGTGYPAWVTNRYLQLPDTVTDRTRALARELVAGQPTVFDAALAVQTHVRQTITYSEEINPPPSDQDVVDYVLFESRQGYCEYYASAMAVLLRAEGIPARVVGGYFPAPFDAETDGFLYREKNAHLWVEVFFPGYGWIPFEPTASQQTLSYGQIQTEELPSPTPTPVPETVTNPVATPEPTPAAAPATVEDEAAPPTNRLLGLVALAASLLVILAAIVGSLIWLWGFRGLSPAGGFYARILRLGRWGGVTPNPALTPAEYADRLGTAIPAAGGPARLVADLYNQETFAGRPVSTSAISTARRAWLQLRRAVVRSLLRRDGKRA
jgi:transglutaminase-like putative cysteine protease